MIDGFGRKVQKREITFLAIAGNIIHKIQHGTRAFVKRENVVNTKQERTKMVLCANVLNAYKYISLGI